MPRYSITSSAVTRCRKRAERGHRRQPVLVGKPEDHVAMECHEDADAAKRLFQQALDEAHRQEMLSWELRAATSLARLLRTEHPADAVAQLRPVYNRFTEGFGTADLVAAKQLLDELGECKPPP